MAKQGAWDITFGMWLSSMILIPIGMFLTYKSNIDSTLFNIEGYTLPLKNLWNKIKRLGKNRQIETTTEPTIEPTTEPITEP